MTHPCRSTTRTYLSGPAVYHRRTLTYHRHHRSESRRHINLVTVPGSHRCAALRPLPEPLVLPPGSSHSRVHSVYLGRLFGLVVTASTLTRQWFRMWSSQWTGCGRRRVVRICIILLMMSPNADAAVAVVTGGGDSIDSSTATTRRRQSADDSQHTACLFKCVFI